MIITTGGEPGIPAASPAASILAAVDVEWSKNYRVPDGNVPFCYSVIWLAVPGTAAPVDLGQAVFSYTSVYVEDPAETQDLVSSADRSLADVLGRAGLIAGHQLCSDLAVLARTAARPLPAVAEMRAIWRQRQDRQMARPAVIDTRYDIGDLLTGTSRRLVDVCGDLRLEVTQPELRGISMTALHRRWTDAGDVRAREKISVLNLRHSLSTALAALYAAGNGRWDPGLNVNQMLAAGLGGAFGWTADPAFTALLADRP